MGFCDHGPPNVPSRGNPPDRQQRSLTMAASTVRMLVFGGQDLITSQKIIVTKVPWAEIVGIDIKCQDGIFCDRLTAKA